MSSFRPRESNDNRSPIEDWGSVCATLGESLPVRHASISTLKSPAEIGGVSVAT